MTAAGQILLVEDSETQALMMRRALEREGFGVVAVDSAERALESLNETLPDLVVADFHLPGMDGGELARQLRLNGRTRGLPLLMLTGAKDQDLERQGLESGVDAYVAKSASQDLILARLKALLRRRASAGDEAGARFRRARVLLIHDSPTARLRLAQVLTAEGYDISAAERVPEPAALLDIDCVVLPLEGVTLDGIALCRELDAVRRNCGAAFHVVVVGGEGEAAADAFAAGADEVGPADPANDLLRFRIRALTRRKLMADEVRRAAAEAAQRVRAEARAAAADELAAANLALREAQSQLVQSAKMASLGELVAGIAHEINNPLAFILGHQATVDRLLNEVGDDSGGVPDGRLDKARDRLGSMRSGLVRIQDLILNLRRFSRLDEGQTQELDVPSALESVLALLKPKLGEIEVRRQLNAPSAYQGSPALLNQVLMNLVSNAADAVEGHGVIRIASRLEDDCYVFEVSDDGPGVPAELRDRIFDPFFTTKPVGSGTGLGLSIAYNVVRAHDGEIAVDQSDLGGARFTVSLPNGVQS